MAAVLHGFADQPVRRLLDGPGCKHLGQPRVVQLVEQPIAAQQVPVTKRRLEFPTVDHRIGFDAQGPGEDVALRVLGRLLRGEFTGPHQVSHEAVVVTHLHQLTGSQAVHPAVSDVGDGENLVARCGVHDGEGAQGRSHSGEIRPGDRHLEDGPVGRPDGSHEARTVGSVEHGQDGGHRLGRSHLATSVASHSIGHHIQAIDQPDRVLVGGSDPTGVAGGPRFQPHRPAARRASGGDHGLRGTTSAPAHPGHGRSTRSTAPTVCRYYRSPCGRSGRWPGRPRLISSTPVSISGAARASGGIGRRAGFRFLCPKGCEGSSPSSRTTLGSTRGCIQPRSARSPIVDQNAGPGGTSTSGRGSQPASSTSSSISSTEVGRTVRPVARVDLHCSNLPAMRCREPTRAPSSR